MTGHLYTSEELTTDVEVDCDVCIIGSGAGGAVMAAGLIERGLSVVMLEEGSWLTRRDFDLDEAKAFSRSYQDRGTRATLDLAITVLQIKGFKAEDFAALHPGGALGRKLSVRVSDVMVSSDYPSLVEDAVIRDAIAPLAEMRGTVPILDPEGRVCGVLTAGDLTRLMERDADFLTCPVRDVMTRGPKTATGNELGSAAASRMEAHGIMALPVVGDDGLLVGMVHLHDLMRAGAV